jgi:hypothetical protein
VRGEYAFAYGDTLSIDLTTAGTLRHQMASPSDTVNLGQNLVLDLAGFCDFGCPAEILGAQVSIDQIDPDVEMAQHLIDLSGHQGVVDHLKFDELAVTIAGQSCRPLAVITGRFSHRGETVAMEPVWQNDGGACDPLDGGICTLSTGNVSWPGDAPVDGIAHGRVGALWPASCAFAGADGTLLLSVGFVGSRIGPLQMHDLAVETSD